MRWRPSPRNGAEGIGLYRTEFLYLNRTSLPTKKNNTKLTGKVARAASGRIR